MDDGRGKELTKEITSKPESLDMFTLKCTLEDGSPCGDWIINILGSRPSQPLVQCSGCNEGLYVILTFEMTELVKKGIAPLRNTEFVKGGIQPL